MLVSSHLSAHVQSSRDTDIPHAQNFWLPRQHIHHYSQDLSSSISSKFSHTHIKNTKQNQWNKQASTVLHIHYTVTMHTPSHFLLLTIFSKQHSMTHFGCSENLYICLLSFLRSQNPHGGLLNHFYCCFSFSGLIKVAVSEEGICSMPPSIINSDSDSKPLYWKVTNPTLSPSHLRGK